MIKRDSKGFRGRVDFCLRPRYTPAMAVGCIEEDAGVKMTGAPHRAPEEHDQGAARELHAEPAAWHSIARGAGARDERVSWRRVSPFSAHARAEAGAGPARSRSARLVMLGLAATVAVVCLGTVARVSSGTAPAPVLSSTRCLSLPPSSQAPPLRVGVSLYCSVSWSLTPVLVQNTKFLPCNARGCYSRA